MKRKPLALLVSSLLLCNGLVLAQAEPQQRLIVLTDIEADPDDTQSLVRLFLYSNQLDIKGIIATTSCWYRERIHPKSIQKVIDAYAEVQPNLLKHEPGYPEAEILSSFIKSGLPSYGHARCRQGQGLRRIGLDHQRA